MPASGEFGQERAVRHPLAQVFSVSEEGAGNVKRG